MLVCHDTGTGESLAKYIIPGCALSDDTVLSFVRGCLSTCFCTKEPAIPTCMIFSNAFLPHKPALADFLGTLSAPLTLEILDSPDPQYTPPDIFEELFQDAEMLNSAGEFWIEFRRDTGAEAKFTRGLTEVESAMRLRPQRVSDSTRRLCAKLLTNLAMLQMVKHSDQDEKIREAALEAALKYARAAEEADPTYSNNQFLHALRTIGQPALDLMQGKDVHQ
ncbi:hypothetical protein FA95DRAFT_1678574 [Auriscalpium vulgare]|uniref:Uncharacterized protein n=1 Tax=Auriscalpium vulgare TaxID=40419 RepID=A0ACB8RWJ5_9AGAM|nr:hypothetical protein FA95DRAFT_1678574 [Auriscalpium vulgare]